MNRLRWFLALLILITSFFIGKHVIDIVIPTSIDDYNLSIDKEMINVVIEEASDNVSPTLSF